MSAFPRTRLRRNRRTPWIRRLVRESALSVDDLIWPVFVHDGPAAEIPVPSMPGVARLSLARLADAAREAADLGIPAMAVFPVIDPSLKSPDGELAFDGGNLVCRAVRAV
jgi:porphobilinogen synthase